MPRKARTDAAKAKTAAASTTPAAKSADTTTAGGTPPPVEAIHPHDALFSVRERSRIVTLSGEIVSLRARAAELIDRADNAAVSLFALATGTTGDATMPRGSNVLGEIDATETEGDSFPFRVRAFAAKLRARAKLATAQQEFEQLRELAGATTAADRMAGAVNGGASPIEALGAALGVNEPAREHVPTPEPQTEHVAAGPGPKPAAPAGDDCPE